MIRYKRSSANRRNGDKGKRNAKTDLQIFRITEQRGYCISWVPKYKRHKYEAGNES